VKATRLSDSELARGLSAAQTLSQRLLRLKAYGICHLALDHQHPILNYFNHVLCLQVATVTG